MAISARSLAGGARHDPDPYPGFRSRRSAEAAPCGSLIRRFVFPDHTPLEWRGSRLALRRRAHAQREVQYYLLNASGACGNALHALHSCSEPIDCRDERRSEVHARRRLSRFIFEAFS